MSRLLKDRLQQHSTPGVLLYDQIDQTIDMKWLHGRDNLDTFLQEANSFHSTIKFTAEVSNDKHVCLTPNPDWMRIEYAQICTQNLRIPTNIFYPPVAILNTAARISHIVLHCASDAFALTQTRLN